MAKQKDLLEILFHEFLAEKSLEFTEANPDCDPDDNLHFQLSMETIRKFVDRARQMLQENQPVSMEFIDSGFAIRFQDNQVIPFIADADVEATGGVGGEVPISKPETRKAQGMAPVKSWGVTGDE